MKRQNYFEIIVGTFVLFCAGFFFFSSFKSARVGNVSGYNLIAKFDNASGVENGSDVKISGVKVGSVTNNSLDTDNFRAVLNMTIDKSVKLPTDSSVKIVSSGFLGGKYIEITPGGDLEILKNDEEIIFTQSSVNFEDLLGKFIFSKNDDKTTAKNGKNK